MKTINFVKTILAISLITMFISCSKDDDNTTPSTPTPTELTINATNLAGKWYEVGYSVSGINLSSQIPTMFQPCTTIKSYFEFTSAGVIKRKQYDGSCVAKDYEGTFSISNSILTYENLVSSTSTAFVHIGTPSGSQVTSLTSTTMKTKFTNNGGSMEITYQKM